MEAFGGGRVTEALALYRQSLSAATDPDMKAALRYNAGTCLLHLKKYGEAREDLTFALAASDRGLQRKALFNLAQALYGDGRIDDALASLRTLLTSDPSNLEAKKLYEWILRNKPPEPPQEPPQNPPPNSPPPPDLLEQLPMPPPTPPPDQPPEKQQVPPGMKPW
jgi:tetratricopeptide (TPR) repeat protein